MEIKKVWDMINQLMDKKQTYDGVQEIPKDNEHVDGQQLADEMNRDFVNIGRYVGQDMCADNFPQGHSLARSVMLLPSTPAEIETIIAELKNNAAA